MQAALNSARTVFDGSDGGSPQTLVIGGNLALFDHADRSSKKRFHVEPSMHTELPVPLNDLCDSLAPPRRRRKVTVRPGQSARVLS
jgi:hypothetical protein